MKNSKDIAYFRQLCCSGLNKDIVIPELLRAIRLMHSNNPQYTHEINRTPITCWLSHDLSEVINYLCELSQGYWTVEPFAHVMSALKQRGYLSCAKQDDPDFCKSELYNAVFAALIQCHGAALSLSQSTQATSGLHLYQTSQQDAFNQDELELLMRLLPYVARALTTPQQEDIEYCAQGNTGLMLLDIHNTLIYQSEAAKELLALAKYPLINPQNSPYWGNNNLDAKIRALCKRLTGLCHGKIDQPPSFCHINGFGRFNFHAEWLDKSDGEADGLVGVTIEHQEPILLKILRGLAYLPLTSTQKEVAALVAQGLSNETISKRLNIKLTTVKDHISKIFTKLDIVQRSGLLPKILAAERHVNLHWHVI